jgi:hypothetical protein
METPSTRSAGHELADGSCSPPVEVWNEYSRRWTTGFVIVSATAAGVVLRRAGDDSPLPVAIDATLVRAVPAAHPHAGDGIVSVGQPDISTTVRTRAAVS